MSLPIHLALVCDGVNIPIAEINRVAAALSKQVERDFFPIWKVSATVNAFAALEDVPVDYWPVIIMRDVEDAAGYHEDKDGQPFAVVEFGSGWSLTASHEVLEMLADPFGRRMRAGNLPDQAIALGMAPQRVRYLVEVCDPSEGDQFSYQINGIKVSDFYTPNFFDPVFAQGIRYSFTGDIDAPRKILEDGYISWEDPTTHDWYQLRMFADQFSAEVPHVLNLSQETVFEELRRSSNLRSAIDRVTRRPSPDHRPLSRALRSAAHVSSDTFQEEQDSNAAWFRTEIQQLKKGSKGQ